MSDKDLDQRNLADPETAPQEAPYGQRDEPTKPDSKLTQDEGVPGDDADGLNDDDDAPAPTFLPRGKLNKPTVVKK